jgi:hypothetical protein
MNSGYLDGCILWVWGFGSKACFFLLALCSFGLFFVKRAFLHEVLLFQMGREMQKIVKYSKGVACSIDLPTLSFSFELSTVLQTPF